MVAFLPHLNLPVLCLLEVAGLFDSLIFSSNLKV